MIAALNQPNTLLMSCSVYIRGKTAWGSTYSLDGQVDMWQVLGGGQMVCVVYHSFYIYICTHKHVHTCMHMYYCWYCYLFSLCVVLLNSPHLNLQGFTILFLKSPFSHAGMGGDSGRLSAQWTTTTACKPAPFSPPNPSLKHFILLLSPIKPECLGFCCAEITTWSTLTNLLLFLQSSPSICAFLVLPPAVIISASCRRNALQTWPKSREWLHPRFWPRLQLPSNATHYYSRV